MAGANRVGDLEVAQDLEHERHEWIFERAGWAIMALVALAALIGLLGPGPLSGQTAGEQGSDLRVEYDRFGRYRAQTELKVHVRPSGAADEGLRLWVDRDYMQSLQVNAIVPEPDSTEVGEDRITYIFSTSGSNPTTDVVFHVEPGEYGRVPARVGLEGGPEVSFSQFFYP